MKSSYICQTGLTACLAAILGTLGISQGYAQSSVASEVKEEGETASVSPADSIEARIHDLGEFVVSVKKEIIHSDGANLTYDMEEDESSKGLSLLDALRKIPMVTVDGQDNIYIKGSTNFKILVNGKEDKILQANAKTMFKSMPAEAVSRIEVITEPGAKYDAEGVGGILNLITEKKQKQQGYSGSVSAGFNSQNYYGALFGSMKYDNFNADASFNYADNHGLGQNNIGDTESFDYTSENMRRQLQEMRQDIAFRFYNASLNMSWEPDTLNLFSWGGSWMDLGAEIDRYALATSVWSVNGTLTRQWKQLTTGSLTTGSASANASWRHNFDSFGNRLILAYAFNFGHNNIKTESETTGLLDYVVTNPFSSNFTTNYTREHTVQIDYSNPFRGQTHLLETGVKGVFRRNSAFSWAGTGNEMNNLAVIDDSRVDAGQIQDIYALYASYSGNFGKWHTRAGIRYEHTLMGMDFHIGDYENFRTHLDDVVPDLSVSYSFSPARTLRLAYQMRISRPSINQLDPYRLTLGSMIREGNPDLESEHNNNVSLTYSNYGRIFGGNISASYSQTDNTIQSYEEYRDGYTYESYGNFGIRRRADISGFLNINLSMKMQMSLNGSINYTDIRDPKAGLGNHGWGGNWGVNWSYLGPADLKFSAYGGQGYRNITISGYYSGWYYYGLAISRDFLKEKTLNVSLNAGNFLTKYTHNSAVMEGAGWKTINHWANRSWNVGINITWRFGKLQEKAKTSGLDLSTDDSAQSAKGKGGISL